MKTKQGESMEKQWWTIKDVCNYTRLSSSTIHRAIDSKFIKVAKVGTGRKIRCGKLLFKREWVDNFMMRNISYPTEGE